MPDYIKGGFSSGTVNAVWLVALVVSFWFLDGVGVVLKLAVTFIVESLVV